MLFEDILSFLDNRTSRSICNSIIQNITREDYTGDAARFNLQAATIFGVLEKMEDDPFSYEDEYEEDSILYRRIKILVHLLYVSDFKSVACLRQLECEQETDVILHCFQKLNIPPDLLLPHFNVHRISEAISNYPNSFIWKSCEHNNIINEAPRVVEMLHELSKTVDDLKKNQTFIHVFWWLDNMRMDNLYKDSIIPFSYLLTLAEYDPKIYEHADRINDKLIECGYDINLKDTLKLWQTTKELGLKVGFTE